MLELSDLCKNSANWCMNCEICPNICRSGVAVNEYQLIAAIVLQQAGCGIDCEACTAHNEHLGLDNGRHSALNAGGVKDVLLELFNRIIGA